MVVVLLSCDTRLSSKVILMNLLNFGDIHLIRSRRITLSLLFCRKTSMHAASEKQSLSTRSTGSFVSKHDEPFRCGATSVARATSPKLKANSKPICREYTKSSQGGNISSSAKHVKRFTDGTKTLACPTTNMPRNGIKGLLTTWPKHNQRTTMTNRTQDKRQGITSAVFRLHRISRAKTRTTTISWWPPTAALVVKSRYTWNHERRCHPGCPSTAACFLKASAT